MSQLNLQYKNQSIQENIRRVASGDTRDLQQRTRKVGWIWGILGGVSALPLGLITVAMLLAGQFGPALFGLVIFGLMLWLCIYGFKSVKNPKFHTFYKHDFGYLCDDISRNTGYPQHPYIPEQWEIPFPAYEEAALANLLRTVNGWGQNNYCFVCNELVITRYTTTLQNAVLFNWCEKGLFVIPIYCDDSGTPRIFLDLTTALPPSAVKYIRVSPFREDSHQIYVKLNFRLWNRNQRWKRGYLHFHVYNTIDGVAFHENHVTQLYVSCNDTK